MATFRFLVLPSTQIVRKTNSWQSESPLTYRVNEENFKVLCFWSEVLCPETERRIALVYSQSCGQYILSQSPSLFLSGFGGSGCAPPISSRSTFACFTLAFIRSIFGKYIVNSTGPLSKGSVKRILRECSHFVSYNGSSSDGRNRSSSRQLH